MGISKMYGDSVKVSQLHYVRAAADLGSFSQAAAALAVTQPALSTGIAALERTLGGSLFERSTTGVTLTPLGTRLMPHLQALLTQLDRLLTEARVATDQASEPLRMGVSPLIHPSLVSRAFQAARTLTPSALILREDNLVDLAKGLLSRQLDLMLVPSATRIGNSQRLRVDTEAIHYLPSSSDADLPGRAGEPVDLVELAGRSLVTVGPACGLTTFTRLLFADSDLELAVYPGEADSYRSLEDWSHLGLGGALMPASRFRELGATRPVHRAGRPVTIDYHAVWLTHTERAAAIRSLLESTLAAG